MVFLSFAKNSLIIGFCIVFTTHTSVGMISQILKSVRENINALNPCHSDENTSEPIYSTPPLPMLPKMEAGEDLSQNEASMSLSTSSTSSQQNPSENMRATSSNSNTPYYRGSNNESLKQTVFSMEDTGTISYSLQSDPLTPMSISDPSSGQNSPIVMQTFSASNSNSPYHKVGNNDSVNPATLSKESSGSLRRRSNLSQSESTNSRTSSAPSSGQNSPVVMRTSSSSCSSSPSLHTHHLENNKRESRTLSSSLNTATRRRSEKLKSFLSFQSAEFLDQCSLNDIPEEEENSLLKAAQFFANSKTTQNSSQSLKYAYQHLEIALVNRIEQEKDKSPESKIFFSCCFLILSGTNETERQKECLKKALELAEEVVSRSLQPSIAMLNPLVDRCVLNDAAQLKDFKKVIAKPYEKALERALVSKDLPTLRTVVLGYIRLAQLTDDILPLQESYEIANKIAKDDSRNLKDLRNLRDISFKLSEKYYSKNKAQHPTALKKALEMCEEIFNAYSQEENINDRRVYCRILYADICTEKMEATSLDNFFKFSKKIEEQDRHHLEKEDFDFIILSQVLKWKKNYEGNSLGSSHYLYAHKVWTYLKKKKELVGELTDNRDLLISSWAVLHYNGKNQKSEDWQLSRDFWKNLCESKSLKDLQENNILNPLYTYMQTLHKS